MSARALGAGACALLPPAEACFGDFSGRGGLAGSPRSAATARRGCAEDARRRRAGSATRRADGGVARNVMMMAPEDKNYVLSLAYSIDDEDALRTDGMIVLYKI